MNRLKQILYLSLAITIVLYVQEIDYSTEQLDVKAWYTSWCKGLSQDELATSSQRSDANELLSTLKNNALESDVFYLMNKQSVSDSMYQNLMPYIIPWAIFLVISIFGWMFYCCYCICDKKCPLCCKRDYEKDKIKKKETMIPTAIAVVLNLIIAAASIAGLVYAGGVTTGINGMKCGLMGVFNDLSYASNNGKFPGLYGIYYSINNITIDFSTFRANLSTTFGGKESAGLTTQKNSIVVFDTNMQRGKGNSSLPVMTTSDGQSTISSTESYLSQNQLFDYILAQTNDSNYGTVVSTFTALSSDYTKYLPAIPQIPMLSSYYDALIQISANLEVSVQPIITDPLFAANLQSGATSAYSSISQVESAAKSLYDLFDPLGQYTDQITIVMYIIFGLLLACGLLTILFALLLQFKQIVSLRYGIHFIWGIYVILMILGFLIGLVLHPASAVTAESCVYLQNMLSSASFYDSTTFITDTSTKAMLRICLHGNGDIFTYLNIQENTDQLNQFSTYTNQFNSTYTTNQASRSIVNANITNNLNSLKNARDGVAIDLGGTQYTNFMSTVSTYNSGSGCTQLVFSSTCSDGTNASTAASPNPSATCWQPSYLVTQSAGSCSASAAFTTLKSHFQAQIQSWQTSVTKETDFISLHNQLDTSFQAYMTKISLFTVGSNQIIQQINTLVGGVSCTFMKVTFQRIIDGLCVLFLPAVYRTTVLLLVVSVAMFFGSLTNCCIGLRFKRVMDYGYEDDENQKPKSSPNQVHPNVNTSEEQQKLKSHD